MAKFGFYKTPRPIALLTDFGLNDNYVGVMKGVIHGICEEARVIDLSHNVKPQDVTGAAFLLSSSYRFFPEKTVFVCVVDPGVGSERNVICMEAEGRIFLAPDNGLLSVIVNQKGAKSLHVVENEEYFLHDVSSTFHGRDIFAPVAAHICEGVKVSELGRRISNINNLRLPMPMKTAAGVLNGEFIYVDQFGNLISNISVATLQTTFRTSYSRVDVHVGENVINGISDSYSEADEGECLALLGSSGYLEVAVNKGSAARTLGCGRGDNISLRVSGD
jgi:S-adenosylmethionine hydrolase